jgi:hypothetical protein
MDGFALKHERIMGPARDTSLRIQDSGFRIEECMVHVLTHVLTTKNTKALSRTKVDPLTRIPLSV